jgi:hypothetical protein
MSMHQTLRFSRTTREAFPQDRYYAIEATRSPESRVVGPVVILAIVALIYMAALGLLA